MAQEGREMASSYSYSRRFWGTIFYNRIEGSSGITPTTARYGEPSPQTAAG
jgi:hypothetical protein